MVSEFYRVLAPSLAFGGLRRGMLGRHGVLGRRDVTVRRAFSAESKPPAQSGAGGTIDVSFRDSVGIIKINRGENRWNQDFLTQFSSALDEVLRHPDVKALVTTGTGKYYSNGVDLAWFDHLKKKDAEKAEKLTEAIWNECILRILSSPLPTIALVNGHAFAGGAMLALSHDHVIMQNTRGWWCVNEVHLNIKFTPGPCEFLKTKLPNGQTLHDAMILGRRFTASEAATAGIVHEACAPEEMYSRALNWVKKVVPVNGYNRKHLQVMKKDVYRKVFAVTENSSEAK